MDVKTERALARAAAKVDKARDKEQEVWAEFVEAMKEANAGGASFLDIAKVVGLTKARVYQIVTGRRGSGKRVRPAA
jgi:hypothetical protein